MSLPSSYPLIITSDYPTMAAPWSSSGPGQTWIWGDFILTLQEQPVSVWAAESDPEEILNDPDLIEYLFAVTVFYQSDKNPYDSSDDGPVLSIAAERSAASESVFVGLFTAYRRINLEIYEGLLEQDAIRQCLFEHVKTMLELSGEPKYIGGLEIGIKHFETEILID
jgi:hypothetical protein